LDHPESVKAMGHAQSDSLRRLKRKSDPVSGHFLEPFKTELAIEPVSRASIRARISQWAWLTGAANLPPEQSPFLTPNGVSVVGALEPSWSDQAVDP
jgi:hypothetical protein